MNALFGIKKEKFFELWHLIARNVFLLINAIIFSVAALLIFFGNIKEGVLLGIIIIFNISLGLIQDIHAWRALEKLRLLTALSISRLNADGSVSAVLLDDLKKNDQVILHLGDQVPSDGVVFSEKGFEVNEALITGESSSFPKKEGERVLAGSIVTSGTAVLQIETIFSESRISKMTEKIQRYTENASPIQESVRLVVKYSGYVLLLVIAFVLFHGIQTGETGILMVTSIGALASMIVPQGLVIAVTLLFAYGSVHLYRKHVLLQDVNAVEKLGRIKNLCLDKTGTLTVNTLTVEDAHVPAGISREEAEYLTTTYTCESGDASQTIRAVQKYLSCPTGGEVSEAMPFSSMRGYGGILMKDTQKKEFILVGAPDIFLPHLEDEKEKEWLSLLIETHGREGKRLLCVVRSRGETIPRELADISLSIVAVYILHNELRAGTRKAIDFFQKRGVVIRIISGDNPETVRAIASLAGVNNTENVITGAEMEKWNDADFNEYAKRFTIFARIKPEQKSKIIEALKKDGFTAMVGDGANDALAIKKADLGIAMFDGAPATRQLASVVLTRNSFAELPEGVALADRIIKNIEIYASVFFNQMFIGVFFFTLLGIFDYSYPFTPLNITFSNYFTVGLPGLLVFYWAIRPSGNIMKENMQSFLLRVIPFPFIAAIVQSSAMLAVFVLYRASAGTEEMSALMVISSILLGIVFFSLAPRVYEGTTSRAQKIQVFWFGLSEVLLLSFAFSFPFFLGFFNVTAVPAISFAVIIPVTIACALVLYFLVWSFFRKISPQP